MIVPPLEPMTARMKTALFSAGLGDVIRNIYLRDAYRMISEATETC